MKDTIAAETLKIITNDEYLEYGVDVAFINNKNDTVIPFGKYAYFGTDSLSFYTPVLEHPNDSTFGRKIAIDRNENILFDMVMYDNGPDFFKEDLIRVQRNGKMGYANKFGQVVIPCIYDFTGYFENGKAMVTLKSREYYDLDNHIKVESDEWFFINKKGKRIE